MTARVITFYSFKGGVGRTQALANVAVALANRSRRVIVVDMDLESPGLHAFFFKEGTRERFKDEALVGRPGLLGYLERCRDFPENEPNIQDFLVSCSFANARDDARPIRLLPAGDLSDNYPGRASSFSWERFYEEGDGYRYMSLLRDQLCEADADYVLIDSRTGMTDVANICTFQLPDTVVVLFALHHQGIEGARRVARAIEQSRREQIADAGPRQLLLVPSRVDETGELNLRDEWLLRVRTMLGEYGDLLADDEQRIPYLPQIAYGERIVVDPAQPTILSKAYHRLVERIDGTAPAAPTAARSFGRLNGILEGLRTQVARFFHSLDAVRTDALAVSDLPQWAIDLNEQRASTLENVRALRAELRSLSREIDPGRPSEAPPALGDELETAGDWKALYPTLRRLADDRMSAWKRHQQERVRERLLVAAGHDTSLIEAPLVKLQPLIANGVLDEVEAELALLQAELARSSIDGLLVQNRLELQRLQGNYQGNTERREWLDGKLSGVLEEGSLGPEVGNVLHNLLRLRMPGLERAERLHFTAYEKLCATARGLANDDARVFEDIGLHLWEAHWRDSLASLDSTGDVGFGQEAQAQMRRMLEGRDIVHPSAVELARSFATKLATQIMAAWSESASDATKAASLLRARREDPALRAAMGIIACGDQPAATRRKLLASWLLGRGGLSDDQELARGYLSALVEEGYDAEAFYALQAIARGGPLPLESLEARAVCLAFLLRALEMRKIEVVKLLLADPEVLSAITELDPGKALLADLALRMPASLAWEGLGSMLLVHLRSSGGTRPLPAEVIGWIEQHPTPCANIAELHGLIEQIRTAGEATFYKAWRSSSYYEADFKLWADTRLQEVLDSTELRDDLAYEIQRLDVQKWIHDTHQVQGTRGQPTLVPERSALANITASFNQIRGLLAQLNSLRPVLGHPTLKEIRSEGEGRSVILEVLLQWLEETHVERPLERLCKSRVVARLRERFL